MLIGIATKIVDIHRRLHMSVVLALKIVDGALALELELINGPHLRLERSNLNLGLADLTSTGRFHVLAILDFKLFGSCLALERGSVNHMHWSRELRRFDPRPSNAMIRCWWLVLVCGVLKVLKGGFVLKCRFFDFTLLSAYLSGLEFELHDATHLE